MATINFALREITAKVVYFGATGAGCTTNVEHLHGAVEHRKKSALHGFGPTETEERSWFFQYAKDGPVDGFDLVIQTYSLPGAIDLEVHRDEVARDVDGVVLVADARPDRNRTNVDALLGLEHVLQRQGRELAVLPAVIQVNHTDAPGARSATDVVFDLNPLGFPVFEGVARQGRGVLETHEAIVTALEARLRNALTGQAPAARLTAIHDPSAPSDDALIQGHIRRIRANAETQAQIAEILKPAAPLDLPVEDGPEIEIPFQPRELVGSHPIRVLSASIHDDRVRIELVMERMGGTAARRLIVWLANRPTDAVALPAPLRNAQAEGEMPERDEQDGRDEPDDREEREPDLELAVEEEDEEGIDYPPLWYGAVGVIGGIAIGGLATYLLVVR